MVRRSASVSILLAASLATVLSGCASTPDNATADVTAAAPDEAAEEPFGITTKVVEAGWTAGVDAGPAGRSNLMGSGTPIDKVPKDTLGLIVEMVWTPSTPASEEMSLAVTRDGEVLGEASGPSPLRLEFPGDSTVGEILLHGGPRDGGAYVSQDWAIHVTTFRGVPFQPGYSALGA